MEKIEIIGSLPVAIKILDGQEVLKLKDFVMRPQTVIEHLEARSAASKIQFLGIIDLVDMTKLIDENGNEHDIPYEALANSPRQNFDYLSEKYTELEAKEIAES